MRFLITGGAGYIGSHLIVDLLKDGHDVVVVDDFSSGHAEALVRAASLAGRTFKVFRGTIADASLMTRALRGVDAVFHLAAFKMVGESMEQPEAYFFNNIGGMSSLLQSMQKAGVHRIVYSSSAAVYGTQTEMPIREDLTLRPDSPYGFSKAEGERLLDWMVQRRSWSAISLRYFNPVGAHPSGRIGEPFERASSLVPRALMALAEDGAPLTIFGSDYPTPDGTCLRDYIHVCDLSRAHLAALKGLEAPGHGIYNVGTGRAYSVREVLDACARVTGRAVPHLRGERRPGDMPIAVADPSRFRDALGFQTRYELDAMVGSAWRWFQNNPTGYEQPWQDEIPADLSARREANLPMSVPMPDAEPSDLHLAITALTG